jgi:hypothetical protein
MIPMHKFILAVLLAATLIHGPSASAQIDWRFGFEDTWALLTGLMTDAQKEALLSKLVPLTASQPAGGDINFPAVNGGWKGMQAGPGRPIDFSASDKAVRLLQKYGFSLLWNLRINAPWSSTGNPDCYGSGDCAPDTSHEQDLYNFIRALVERYDGDGYQDMGYETPDKTEDDLVIPVRHYLMTGEIEFIGATPQPLIGGYGDEALMHFWTDSMENLLRTHRIIYRAIQDADPSGSTKLISSGGVLWDLYSDFPDWPEVEGPTVLARLNGQNNHHVRYVESFNRLKQILTSFGDDSDGIECDYIGWHPHMPWREVEQTFAFIRRYAGTKPIFIDDMWCNMFLFDRADAPGNTLFTGGGKIIEGDFPNTLVPNYTTLKNGVLFNNQAIAAWYYLRHARTMVKAFASVFGEGAQRASISAIADFITDKQGIVGTLNEDFYEKPGYYTYGLLVEKLFDFTQATEIPVSSDPRTRAYKFIRPRGPIYILWSETGDAPPGLDYQIPTGETITLAVESDTLLLTRIISEMDQKIPEIEHVTAQSGRFTIQLGYEPFFLEPVGNVPTTASGRPAVPAEFRVDQNYPNPFNLKTTIQFVLPKSGFVKLMVYDLHGRMVATLAADKLAAGVHIRNWNARGLASGVYFYSLEGEETRVTRKMLLLQ